MATVLWIGDAGWSSGFSRVTHAIGERLVKDYGHEIHVLAIGYEGKDPYSGPLKLYRAEAGPAHHALGFDRVVELLARVKPDVVITLEDATTIHMRLTKNRSDPDQRLRKQKILSYLPVDGHNLPPSFREILPMVKVVAMSEFGRAQLGGSIPVIWHGVEQDVFHPATAETPVTTSTGMLLRSKEECREAFGIPPGAFVIGRVDTNSGRKDWPSTWRACDGFFRAYHGDAIALFHTKLQGSGVELEALISRGPGKYYVTNGGDWPVEDLVALVNSFSIFLSTSRGEGFGLGMAEAMACGVPVIATRGSAITEVVGPGGILVNPSPVPWTNPYGVDMDLADTAGMTDALLELANDPERREALGRAGLDHVGRNMNWDTAARLMNEQIESLIGGIRPAALEQRQAARVGG
jgi:glycosyltransferase involved in cell wall biosynthesis